MNDPIIRPYERSMLNPVLDLLFYSRRTHIHLDWHRVRNWLDIPENIVHTSWQGTHLVGVVGASAPLGGTSWVRLAAVDNAYETLPNLQILWQAAQADLLAQRVRLAGWLVANRWVANYLPLLGLQYQDTVVTLGRAGDDLPPAPPAYEIHNAYLEQLPDLVTVDHQAFAPPWQLSRDEIRQAQRQAASCTVAVLNDAIIGYQITTRHQASAHLARLAVLPQYQGRGVGARLLYDLLLSLFRRHVRTITVNTQQTNEHSQRLYARFGFRRNGYDLPVWFWQAQEPAEN
jgi:ribosomal-protein-alanine N-acetyltransferase